MDDLTDETTEWLEMRLDESRDEIDDVEDELDGLQMEVSEIKAELERRNSPPPSPPSNDAAVQPE